MGPDGVYTMLKLDGKDVGGLYKLMPDMVAQGIPPHWISYVAVTSADESAEKAKAAGATLLKEPFDVFTMGRMAVVQDPTGAVFALWQAKDHKGAGIYNVPGFVCWNELGTNDTAESRRVLFEPVWLGQRRFVRGSDRIHDVQKRRSGAGGMYKITPEMGPIPPHWLVYFAVDDCDAKVQKATELGAQCDEAGG